MPAVRLMNPRLNKLLNAYATAATAAGVGILGTPSEAKIVYTPANVSIGVSGNFQIDLNNDGIADFEILRFSCEHSNCLVVNPLIYGNGIKAGTGVASQGFAGAGLYGTPVGPKAAFLDHFNSSNGGGRFVGFMADESVYGKGGSGGPWAHTANRYLGFQFLINGKLHYGWARMSVSMRRNRIVLTGYAYETIPNHKILEGQTQGVEVSSFPEADMHISTSQLASLGMLAHGADGLAVWRRDDETVAAA